MDREMTLEENYCFDIAGYLVVRNVLTPDEVRACNRALDGAGKGRGMLGWPAPLRDPFVRLRDHSVLAGYLDQLTHEGARLDRDPWLIGASGEDTVGRLVGGSDPGDRRRAYRHQNGVRFCQGLLAIWALTDIDPGDGGFVFVPASHRSEAETPRDLLAGADDMGLVRGPDLKAGDLLLCADTLLHGVRPWKADRPRRLLAYGWADEFPLMQ